jgi:hypothetical protein
MNKPLKLTKAEWEELVQVLSPRNAAGRPDTNPRWLVNCLYAVKFSFRSDVADYVGDLYLVHGNMLSGVPPLVFTRRHGKLVPEGYFRVV